MSSYVSPTSVLSCSVYSFYFPLSYSSFSFLPFLLLSLFVLPPPSIPLPPPPPSLAFTIYPFPRIAFMSPDNACSRAQNDAIRFWKCRRFGANGGRLAVGPRVCIFYFYFWFCFVIFLNRLSGRGGESALVASEIANKMN